MSGMALAPEEIEALLEQGQQDAARQDKAKREAFTGDYEPLGDATGRYRSSPSGSRRSREDDRPTSRRSNESHWEERARGSDRTRRHGRYYEDEPRRDYGRRSDRSRSPGRRSSHRDGASGRGYSNGERDRYRARSPGPHDRSPRSNGRPDRSDGEGDRARRNGGPRHSPRHGGRRGSTPQSDHGHSDARTVFVNQLANRLRTRELEAFFSQVGTVVEATIVKDRVTHRSKGVGYVQFKEEESVPKAINLTGRKLLGIPVIVQLTEAEKNRQARTTENAPSLSNGAPFHRLYVGNIHFNITEEDLQGIFETYGEIDFVQLHRDENGRSRGYGFVQFQNADNAKSALAELNNFELAGRPIRVGLGNDRLNQDSQNAIMQRFNQNSQTQGSSFSGAGGRGSHAGGSTNFENQQRDKGTVNSGALDDSEVGGVNFNNFSRDSLMKKLARTEDSEPVAKSGKAAAVPKPSVAKFNPSRCILVKNAYDESSETEPNWEKDLEEDFRDECAQRYGPVVHTGIPSERSEGAIFVKFQDVAGGDNALKGLNGRFFGGRVLTAQPVVDAIYNTNFPKARNL